MQHASISYSGPEAQVANHILALTDLLNVDSVRRGHSSFAITIKDMQQSNRYHLKLDLEDLNVGETEALLIYRYLSATEIQLFEKLSYNFRVYVVLYKFLDFEFLMKQIRSFKGQIFFLVDSNGDSCVRNYYDLRTEFTKNNFIVLEPRSVTQNVDRTAPFKLQIPVFLLIFLKSVVNPIDELKRYFLLMKVSNNRVVARGGDLLSFLFYWFGQFLGRTIDSVNFLYRVCTKLFNFLYYGIFYYFKYRVRHFILMAWFRTYGVLVDVFFGLINLGIISYNFVRYVLIWPFRKVFWFCRYQFDTRVRKYIK